MYILTYLYILAEISAYHLQLKCMGGHFFFRAIQSTTVLSDIYIYIYICIGYSPGWRQLWAYNTREIIGRGRSPRQLSQGCYMP